MGTIVTLIVGGITGWIASIIMKTNAQMGIVTNVIVGVVGSLLGYWLAGLMGFSESGSIARWIVGVIGAALLIAVLKALNVFNEPTDKRLT